MQFFFLGYNRSLDKIMRFVDLIEKKKKGFEHTKEEIDFIVSSVTKDTVPDYQISAWLMAVYFQGMTEAETAYFTDAIIKSGEVIDLSSIGSSIADKHSTGGVGDKITIILIPLLASCGIPVAKLSGRGLGHTGGTIDKLESIPGFKTDLKISQLIQKVKKNGLAIASQTKKLTPADGKLYALRDVTATVDSMPLIASSVVSKKIASGADFVVLDVKYGSGAFIKTEKDAETLSSLMTGIASKLGRKFNAVISSMAQPLGRMVGNSLEIEESIDFLKGTSTPDIKELTYEIAALTLIHFKKAKDRNEAFNIIDESIQSGKALKSLKKLIKSQGGNPDVINDFKLFKQPLYSFEIKAEQDGFVNNIDAYKIAYACKLLGAGREKKTDSIDYSAGIKLNKIYAEYAKKGETIATLFSDSEEKLSLAEPIVKNAFEFSDETPAERKIVYKVI